MLNFKNFKKTKKKYLIKYAYSLVPTVEQH